MALIVWPVEAFLCGLVVAFLCGPCCVAMLWLLLCGYFVALRVWSCSVAFWCGLDVAMYVTSVVSRLVWPYFGIVVAFYVWPSLCSLVVWHFMFYVWPCCVAIFWPFLYM